MINFIQTYWLTLLIVLTVLIVGVVLWIRGQKDFVKNAIYLLVCRAEQQFGSKTGPIKWIMVYNSLPWWVRLTFSQEILAEYIEAAVQYLKDQLNTNKFNLLTYSDESPTSYSIK